MVRTPLLYSKTQVKRAGSISAVLARVPHLDTLDGALISRSGQIGDPPLIIGRPSVPEQLTLDDAEGEDDGTA